MTLPTLIQKHNEQATVIYLKKIYSMLGNAFLMAQNNNDAVYTWGINEDTNASVKSVAEKVIPYLKVIRDCGTDTGEECVSENFKGLNGTGNWSHRSDSIYKFIIADGATLTIGVKTPCLNDSSYCVEIYADVNGKKSPNVVGKDLFKFNIYGNGTIRAIGYGTDPNMQNLEEGASPAHYCNPKKQGFLCSAWVIGNGNMDYLHCADDLSWAGKHSCK